VMKTMYEDSTTMVKMNGRVSRGCCVKVGVHQCPVLLREDGCTSVLSLLQFIIVLEHGCGHFRRSLPFKLLYADDLVLITDTEELLMERSINESWYGTVII